MNVTEIERFIDKVYAYAVKRTFTEEEAADLSQEILFTAVKGLPGLRENSMDVFAKTFPCCPRPGEN